MTGSNGMRRRILSSLAMLVRALPILCLSIQAAAAPVCTTQTVGDEEFRGISGSSDTNIIGVGKKGVIYRYDGAAWNAMPNPGGEDLNDVEVVNNATAFAVGKKGETLQLVAGSWVSRTGFTNQDLFGVWAASANAAWVVGAKGTLFFYNGASWTSQKAAAGTGNGSLTDAWGNSSFFYALDDDGTLYRFDRGAGTWSSPDTLCKTGNGFEDLWGDSAGNIYLVKRKEVYRHNGTSCSVVANSSQNLNGVSGAGNQVFAVGKKGVVLQYDGVTWQESVEASSEINDVWVSGTGNPYFAGKKAEITSCAEAIPVFVVNSRQLRYQLPGGNNHGPGRRYVGQPADNVPGRSDARYPDRQWQLAARDRQRDVDRRDSQRRSGDLRLAAWRIECRFFAQLSSRARECRYRRIPDQ